MPKPIVRKSIVGDASFLEAHPEMQRSEVSTGLEKLAAAHKERVENLSPNAKLMLDSLKDSGRYDALTDPDNGCIVKTEIEIGRACAKAILEGEQVSELVDGIGIPREPVCPAGIEEIEFSKEFWAKQSTIKIARDAHVLRTAASNAAMIASKLAKLVTKLVELKAEAEELEKKITDDSNLPDFEALTKEREDSGIDMAERDALTLVTKSGDVQVEIAQDTPVNEDNPHDHPIKWSYWYEAGGDVISPSMEGAMAMAALRIKRTVVAEHINAWQEK